MSDAHAATKIEFPVDKREWHPSPLPGQVVPITTVDGDGQPNMAPKSWVSMVASGPPPVLMLGCSLDHATARNAIAQGEFVVNVPGRELVERVWQCGSGSGVPGPDRFERCRLTPVPSLRIRPARIAECRAHLECDVDGHRAWGREVAVSGCTVAASGDAAALEGDQPARYRFPSPFFFLVKGWSAVLGPAQHVGA